MKPKDEIIDYYYPSTTIKRGLIKDCKQLLASKDKEIEELRKEIKSLKEKIERIEKIMNLDTTVMNRWVHLEKELRRND